MTPQDLQFELMKQASFNEFDGESVVESLQTHKDLWKGAVMDRAGHNAPQAPDYSSAIDLIKLRDLPEYWSVDTLYITPVAGKEAELEQLAKTWGADEVDFIGGEEACSMLGNHSPALLANDKVILRVWWD